MKIIKEFLLVSLVVGALGIVYAKHTGLTLKIDPGAFASSIADKIKPSASSSPAEAPWQVTAASQLSAHDLHRVICVQAHRFEVMEFNMADKTAQLLPIYDEKGAPRGCE